MDDNRMSVREKDAREHKPEITHMMKEIEDSICDLDKAIINLGIKILPVLSPEPEEKPQNNTVSAIMSTQICESLRELMSFANELTRKTNSLTKRVEL